jgi:hypothetical protein
MRFLGNAPGRVKRRDHEICAIHTAPCGTVPDFIPGRPFNPQVETMFFQF